MHCTENVLNKHLFIVVIGKFVLEILRELCTREKRARERASVKLYIVS